MTEKSICDCIPASYDKDKLDILLDKYCGSSIKDVCDNAIRYIEEYDGDNSHIINAKYALSQKHSKPTVERFIANQLTELWDQLLEYYESESYEDYSFYNIFKELTDCDSWDWSEFDIHANSG